MLNKVLLEKNLQLQLHQEAQVKIALWVMLVKLVKGLQKGK